MSCSFFFFSIGSLFVRTETSHDQRSKDDRNHRRLFILQASCPKKSVWATTKRSATTWATGSTPRFVFKCVFFFKTFLPIFFCIEKLWISLVSLLSSCRLGRCEEREAAAVVPVVAQFRSLLRLERHRLPLRLGARRVAQTKGPGRTLSIKEETKKTSKPADSMEDAQYHQSRSFRSLENSRCNLLGFTGFYWVLLGFTGFY